MRRGSGVVEPDRRETMAIAIAGVYLLVDPMPQPGLTAERVVLREAGCHFRFVAAGALSI